jgi:hypothetical protein
MVHIPSILALKAQYGQVQYLLHACVCVEQLAKSDGVAVLLSGCEFEFKQCLELLGHGCWARFVDSVVGIATGPGKQPARTQAQVAHETRPLCGLGHDCCRFDMCRRYCDAADHLRAACRTHTRVCIL